MLTESQVSCYLVGYVERVDHNEDEQHQVEVELPVEVP